MSFFLQKTKTTDFQQQRPKKVKAMEVKMSPSMLEDPGHIYSQATTNKITFLLPKHTQLK